MTNEEMLDETRDADPTCRMLAQRLIREDRTQALSRPGLTVA